MNTSHLPRRLAVAIAVFFLSPSLPTTAFAAQTVDLPADPPARRSVALEEVWRLGGEEDDGVLLGLVTGGVLDDDGNVLLVDQQLARVLVVSPGGEVLVTLGREGDGPGEMRRLLSAFAAGERVGMVQGYPGRVVFLDREGLPAGGFDLGGEAAEGGFFAIRDLHCTGTALIAHTSRSTFDENEGKSSTRSALSVMDLDGTLAAELVSHQVERGTRHVVMDESASWAEFATWAVSPRGVVGTLAERDAWAVNERNLDGELLRVLRRPFRPRKRTAEEKEEAVSRIRLAVVSGGATIEKRPLDTDPAIVDLQYAADGYLFVTNCHNESGRLEAGVAGRFDVVAPDGKFVEELTLTFPDHDPEQDVLVMLDGTHFLVLRNFEDAEKAIYADFLSDEEKEDLGDAEPLEVVLVRVPD
ncbi:MAG: hypothetical protein GY838_11185 [bacterium]|nr:hypothetical protein [bacterium]